MAGAKCWHHGKDDQDVVVPGSLGKVDVISLAGELQVLLCANGLATNG